VFAASGIIGTYQTFGTSGGGKEIKLEGLLLLCHVVLTKSEILDTSTEAEVTEIPNARLVNSSSFEGTTGCTLCALTLLSEPDLCSLLYLNKQLDNILLP